MLCSHNLKQIGLNGLYCRRLNHDNHDKQCQRAFYETIKSCEPHCMVGQFQKNCRESCLVPIVVLASVKNSIVTLVQVHGNICTQLKSSLGQSFYAKIETG